MTGRHGYEGRPERQNEYFIPGDGISREVIQADICRYLGNDALGRQGYFIRAYRNLTSEMIADLKADSARWEADVMRRADQGYPRGSYIHDYNVRQAPNVVPAPYASSSIHEVRQQGGPSPPPTYSQPPSQPYPPYTAPSSYPSSHSPFAAGQNPYPPQVPYSAPGQPAVSADMHPSYTYTSNTGYPYENGRSNAPRYTGPGYETESDYSPVTSGMTYPATTAPDPRIGMDPRYTPEFDRNRPQATRESQAPRRTR
ncbi:putative transcription factor RfeG [Aspergillus novofumigatus IBT 16806]|uniref:Putative transcription factor RfeG n=1 Tax=Aspergillus novofumigatus (strain IBT 16806) TaxID=1392255 RepID=A0A2I1CHS8_ASPN1|nr:putative transcription factor RfeG [Aspergillus novofumigatus IBT 16806]PKX97163.1 putative transcription factor RfeG [Aspergillus novofumigatus IBT 16806]